MAEDDTDRATTTRIRQLEKLDGLAKTFGRSLSTALSGSLGSGRQLDSLQSSGFTHYAVLDGDGKPAIKEMKAPARG